MAGTPGYFQGKTIVITGAASGIGRATAQIFTREGANVVACDIDDEGNENTVEIIRQTGGRALAVATDVTRREDVDAAVAEAIREFGRIDFMFNCAGAAVRRSGFLDIDDDLWQRTWAINVNGVLYGMQAVLPHMLENGKGVIVNVASMSHKRGGPGTSVHYASAKGAVLTMSLGVAREFASRGIRCLSISPGPVETPFQAAAATTPDTMATFLSDVPMGRFGKPEEIGELVLFMCSDACEFVKTGQPESAFTIECERGSRSCQAVLIKGLSAVSARVH